MLLIITAAVGLTFIVTQSKLFKQIRNFAGWIHPSLGHYMQCTMCFGVLAGVGCWGLDLLGLDLLLIGFTVSILSYSLYLLLKPLMDKYD